MAPPGGEGSGKVSKKGNEEWGDEAGMWWRKRGWRRERRQGEGSRGDLEQARVRRRTRLGGGRGEKTKFDSMEQTDEMSMTSHSHFDHLDRSGSEQLRNRRIRCRSTVVAHTSVQ